jgi:hypothetical protein
VAVGVDIYNRKSKEPKVPGEKLKLREPKVPG